MSAAVDESWASPHHDITHDHEPITLAGLFQNLNEGITASRSAEKWQSPITRAGDKVQVMRAVGAMQAAGHDKPHRTGSIVPALAKNARTGHPQFRNGKGKHGRAGHPPPTNLGPAPPSRSSCNHFYSSPNSLARAFHLRSTSAFVLASITISSGQGRVKPSVGHFLVASIPIFDPKFARRDA